MDYLINLMKPKKAILKENPTLRRRLVISKIRHFKEVTGQWDKVGEEEVEGVEVDIVEEGETLNLKIMNEFN